MYSSINQNFRIVFGMTLAGMTLMLAATSGRAQSTNNMYLDVRAGVALPQNTTIQDSPYGNNGTVSFDAGLHVGLNLGYNLSQSFAAELETGVRWNPVKDINGNSVSTLGGTADLYQIPLLANLVYRPLHGAFVPYIGAGAGGVISIFDSSNLPLFGPATSYNSTDFVFAYQATVGFKYAVSEKIDLGLAYEFLGTTGQRWTDHAVPFDTDGVLTHSIMATFSWRF
jgi:opacity protein-like surface antigen